MKKTYGLWLDEDAVTTVKSHLEANKQNLSAFVNLLLVEFASEIKQAPGLYTKPVEEMTLIEFGELVKRYSKLLQDK